MNNLIDKYKKATIKGKIGIILAVFFLMFLFMAVAVYVLGMSLRNLPGNDTTLSPFYYALNTKFGKPLSLALIGVIFFVFLLLLLTVNKKNFVKKDDERGVHYMEQATHGSAEWMDKDRAKEVFTVCNIKDTNEVIYGQFTSNGEQVVGYKKPKGAEFNRNIFVLAPSGSGKSYTQVKTDLVQHVKAGHSVAVTDPDGGLYGDFAPFCRDMGCKVHVINFADPSYSECWDMVKECINPETERLDGTRLNMFVNTFMANTGEGTRDFFYDSASNLIKAVIGYTCYKNEDKITTLYERLYLKVTNFVPDQNDEYMKRVATGPVSFVWCRKWIMNAALKNGYKKEDIEAAFKAIKEYADTSEPFTMGKVYQNIIQFKEVVEYMEKGESPVPLWHPAYTNYQVYKSNDTDQVRKSAHQGALLRFGLFIDPNITHILSNEGLDLNKFNTEQTVLFVVTQDKSDETDPIASILFTFLFKDIQDVFDKNKQLAKANKVPNPCRGSAVILDDFFSLGVIGGRPELFAKTMADARKREVYITIVVQQYSQIEALYGSNFNHSIQGNCATLVYLGGNDPETIEFISEFAGEATALDEAHQETSRIFSTGALQPGYRSSTTKRDLLTKGEAREWKDRILVIQQGEQPLDLHPFTWVELPEYKEGKIKPTSIYSDLKSIYERTDIFKSKAKIERNTQLTVDEMIANLRNFDVNPDTGEVIDDIGNDFEEVQFTEEELLSEDSSLNSTDLSIRDE